MSVRFKLVALGLGASWLSLACAEPTQQLSWRFRFASEDLSRRAEFVQAELLRGGCEGELVFASEVTAQGSGAAPSRLKPGRYGFRGRARDASCAWFAAGCRELALPRQGAIEVVLSALSTPELDPGCAGADGEDQDASEGDEDSGFEQGDEDADGEERDAGDDLDGGDADRGEGGSDDGGVPAGIDAAAEAGSDAELPPLPDAGADGGRPVFDPSAPKCAQLDRAVVACFDFERSLADLSGRGNDALGPEASFEPGLAGDALRVAGTRVAIENDATLNFGTFTIELWLRSDGLDSLSNESDDRTILIDKDEQYLLGHEPSGAAMMQLYRSDNDSESLNVDASFALSVGVWTYLVYAYDGTVAFVYKDGERIDSSNLGVTLTRGSGAPLHLGSGSPDVTRTFNGLFDALRISNVARGDAAICAEAGKQLIGGRCE